MKKTQVPVIERFVEFKRPHIEARDVNAILQWPHRLNIDCHTMDDGAYLRLFEALAETLADADWTITQWMSPRRYLETAVVFVNGRLCISERPMESVDIDTRPAAAATTPFRFVIERYESGTSIESVVEDLLALALLRCLTIKGAIFRALRQSPRLVSSNLRAFVLQNIYMRADGLRLLTAIVAGSPRLRLLRVEMNNIPERWTEWNEAMVDFFNAVRAHKALAVLEFGPFHVGYHGFEGLCAAYKEMPTLKALRYTNLEVAMQTHELSSIASIIRDAGHRVRLDFSNMWTCRNFHSWEVDAIIGTLQGGVPLDIRWSISGGDVDIPLIEFVATHEAGKWIELCYRHYSDFHKHKKHWAGKAIEYLRHGSAFWNFNAWAVDKGVAVLRRKHELYFVGYDGERGDARIYPDDDLPVLGEPKIGTFVECSWPRVVETVHTHRMEDIQVHGIGLRDYDWTDPALATLRAVALFSCGLAN